MLTARPRISDDGTHGIQIEGTIDESTDFAKLLSADAGNLCIYCKDVVRINSMGVHGWQQFFAGLRSRGIWIRFCEVSPALMTNANHVADFILRSEIHSICLPYTCLQCSSRFSVVKALSEIKANSCLSQACPNCQGNAEFDDKPNEYFVLLE